LYNFLTPWHIVTLIFYSFFLIKWIDARYSLWYLRISSYFLSLFIFFYSLLIFYFFEAHCGYPQFICNIVLAPVTGFYFNFSIDGISLFFILLSTFITPFCLLINWNFSYYLKEYILFFTILELFLVIAFSSNDLFLFFVAFESILIPMFLIIGLWGSRPERIKAAYWFFFFTLVGSIFFLYAICVFYFAYGSTNLEIIKYFIKNNYYVMCYNYNKFLWFCIFLAFAVKIPLFPFHVWLPEAHVEAPTAGSVLLASLLLKLGGYGIIRFLITLLPLETIYFTPFVYMLCFLGIFYTSIIAIRQLDLKRLIAYSSVSHMNYVVLGLFSFNNYGILGGIQLMLSHGIVSTALFFLVGVLYDRYRVRLINYYSGLTTVMPLFSCFFGLFIFSNAGFPMLCNFPGEFLIFANIILNDLFFSILILLGLYFTGVYSIWLLNRIVFGSLNIYFSNKIGIYLDLNRREFFILIVLSILNFVMGLFPNCFTFYICKSVYLNQSLFY
jgi:proton-translocating NADH-quinone oxidoreductase chain M